MNYEKITFLSVAGAVCLVVLGIGAFTHSQLASSKSKDVCPRVGEIINLTLREGEQNVNGIQLYTRVPMNSGYVDEIKAYGVEALPCIAEHLSASDVRERRLALDLIGNIGGTETIDIFQGVIRTDKSVMLRNTALHWVNSIDDPKAKAVVKEAAESNTEKEVRFEGQKMLKAESKVSTVKSSKN